MPAIERTLSVLLAATLGCAADAYELGALGEEGSGGASGSDGVADGTEGSAVDPLEGASPIKLYQGEGLLDVAGGLWDVQAGWLLVADASADAVLRVAPGSTTTRLTPAGAPRGLAVDEDGALLMAQSEPPRVVKVGADDAVEVLAQTVEGDALVEPHAIGVAPSGARYVTDVSQGVLRIDPDGTASWAATDLDQPQGLVLDPAYGRLLVGERASGRVVAYDVQADGTLADPRTLVTAGAPVRGLCIDDASNLYAATDAGLEVFAPDGTRWGAVASPEPLTDCSFGRSGSGVLLLLMAPTAIYGIDLQVDGPP